MTASRKAYVECIQTGAPSTFTSIGVVAVNQTLYGKTNGEVYIDLFSFADLEGDRALETLPYTERMALDEISARKLIQELSIAFNLNIDLKSKNRM